MLGMFFCINFICLIIAIPLVAASFIYEAVVNKMRMRRWEREMERKRIEAAIESLEKYGRIWY